MNNKVVLKRLIPPIVIEFLRKKTKYGYFGNYKTWQEALANSSGYDEPTILEKVKNAMLKIKKGEATYERDSIIFGKKEYSWPVLASLLWIASKNNNKLTVIDFGGSLGSSYYQNKDFLKHIELKWYVIEQQNFVQCGQQFFEDDVLHFVDSIEKIPSNENSVFLASSSLQYIESPYDYMNNIIQKNFAYIILDRTAFLTDNERLTIQKVRPDIYTASYPAWFLNEKKFRNLFTNSYTLISDFESIGARSITLQDNMYGYLKGFIYEKNH